VTSRVDRAIEWLVRPWLEGAGAAARAGRVLAVALGLTLVILPGMILYFGIDGWWWDTTIAVLACAPLGIIVFDNVALLLTRLVGREVTGLSRVAILFLGLTVGVLGGYLVVMAVHMTPDRSVDALMKDYRRTMSILLPVLTTVAVLGTSLWYRGEAFRLESALATARFDALNGQMQPHFLFNALNSLKALIEDDPALAADVTQRVADLYRLIMKVSKDATSTLADEVAIVESYLEIERVRFGDRLSYAIDVPAELSALHVPSLVLQTLVENAVKHGVCKARGGGEVRVRAARSQGGSLELEVSNTGAPYDPGSRDPSLAPPTGLANTRARLALMYGASSRFAIDFDAKAGTRVTFSVTGAKIG
jgi:signal transduction histidine kinase